MAKTQKLDYMRNKSVQIIIVTWKIWNLSLQIQGKSTSINSVFFCSTIFSFTFLSTPKVKETVNYTNEEYGRLKNRCNFMELNTAWKVPKYGVFSGPYLDIFHTVKWLLMLQKRSIFRNMIYNLLILST